jgi:hypothetical protein
MIECTDCNLLFERPQALGSHRRAAHGVMGASKRAGRYRATMAGRTRPFHGPLEIGRQFGWLTVRGHKFNPRRPSSVVECRCEAAVALMHEFREYRHELDMIVIRSKEDPERET